MAVASPPVFIQGGSHPAVDVRRSFEGLVAGRGGIMRPEHMLVTQRAAGVNMSVDVAPGFLVLPGTESSTQGFYLVENRSVTNLTIAAPSANPRHDLVVATVRDAAYATGPSNDFRLHIVQGTASVTPVDPSIPANSWVLARVYVNVGAVSITNAVITDHRTGQNGYASTQSGLSAPAGARFICTSGTRPSSPYNGMEIYELDTGYTYVYFVSSWVIKYALGRIGLTMRSSNTGTITTTQYPMSVTATTLPNRRLRVTTQANIQAVAGNTGSGFGVANGAGTILNQSYVYQPTAAVADLAQATHYLDSGAGGSLTFQTSVFAGASGAIMLGAATAYAWIGVWDEGPA